MIEYLNAISTVLLLITVVSLLGRERLDLTTISEGIEPLKKILEFLSNFPKWLHCYNDLNGNVCRLRDRRDRLRRRLDDLRTRVEDEEFRTGRERKKEVDNWLSSAETKDTELWAILHAVDREMNSFWKFLRRAWLGNLVEKKIQDLDDLFASGSFEEVLTHSRKVPKLEVRPLVGTTASENVRTILAWLQNGVTKIGVHGIRGIGKTAIMKHIHNDLLRHGDVNVCMIQAPKDCTEYEYHLQTSIAQDLVLDIQKDDVIKRAAFLCQALRRRNFVLILDDLKRYFAVENVGIPLDAAKGKMIITSRSPDVCRKMGCQNHTIAVNPLQYDEAQELFKQRLELPSMPQPPIEDVARQIVDQCRGVALKIVDKAKDLIGIDDITKWQGVLDEMILDNASENHS